MFVVVWSAKDGAPWPSDTVGCCSLGKCWISKLELQSTLITCVNVWFVSISTFLHLGGDTEFVSVAVWLFETLV